jgi:hypothetical protein
MPRQRNKVDQYIVGGEKFLLQLWGLGHKWQEDAVITATHIREHGGPTIPLMAGTRS